MNTTAIAQHLNVAEAAIVEVQEWARVLWVRVKGLGARFVSKKVTKMEVINKEATFANLAKAGKVWQGYGNVRVYLNVADVLDLSKNQARRYAHTKFYFDAEAGFGHLNLSDADFQKCIEVVSWAVVK